MPLRGTIVSRGGKDAIALQDTCIWTVQVVQADQCAAQIGKQLKPE